MLVKSYGFVVSAGNEKITIGDLVADLVAKSGDEYDSQGQLRRVFIDSTASVDFVVGLVVTIKDQKFFCELVDEGGNFVVSVTNLDGDNKLMEFNFFVINKLNGHGLYQHYFHSCSPGAFGSHLRTQYRRLSELNRDKEIADLKASGNHSAKKEKSIRSSYAKGLSFSLLVHNKTLEQVLSEFKKIKAFEYEFSAIEPNLVKGAPISNYVKRLTQKVSFDPNVAVGLLAKAIQGSVDVIKPKSGRVSVIQDVDGVDVPMSVKLLDIPENFGEEDYDTVAGKLDDMDTSKFFEHQVIAELMAICKDEYPHVFMKAVKVAKP